MIVPPPPHEHEWEVYTDMPPGEIKRYRQCKTCKKIGYTKEPPRPGYLMRNVYIYKCFLPGCTQDAIARLKGRLTRSAFRWVCQDHLNLDELPNAQKGHQRCE